MAFCKRPNLGDKGQARGGQGLGWEGPQGTTGQYSALAVAVVTQLHPFIEKAFDCETGNFSYVKITPSDSPPKTLHPHP